MVAQLFKGLTYLHDGICHFDVKPENVTYNPMTKRFKYIDFGYAEIYPFVDTYILVKRNTRLHTSNIKCLIAIVCVPIRRVLRM